MRTEYYYLVSSLPMLYFGTSPSISYDDFMARCRGQLSDSDMRVLNRASVEPAQTAYDCCHILQEWKEFDVMLRNELVRMRAVKMGKDASGYIRGEYYPNPFIARYAQLIYNQDSPLESERLFDRIRWEKAEDLKLGHFFDIDYLILFAIQLQISERWKKVNQEEGIRILEELTGSTD